MQIKEWKTNFGKTKSMQGKFLIQQDHVKKTSKNIQDCREPSVRNP